MKKVLSFVLSVAMVICLMPAMAFAADDTTTGAKATGLSQFSDADSITNKEAVAVLVGLGVIDGMGDGTFQPAGNLTRAQASKLVATVVKSGDKTDIPAPTADPFTDVATTYWGAGAIKFGVDNGYINGMGDGTFHPEDQVTTAQLATMLEKVLGFTVSDVNYNWPENAMAIAKGGQEEVDVNLLEGITKGAGEALSRDDAAQMIFNALTSDDVVKSSTTGGNAVDGTTGYAAVRTNKEGYTGVIDGIEQLIEKYFPKATRKAEFTDDFGRSATKWKNGREDITDEVIEAAEYVYTAKTAEKALKSTLDDYVLSDVEVWDNGVRRAGRALEVKDIAELTGNGTLVELYPNERDTAIDKIIVINYEPAKVTNVNSVKGEVSFHAVSGDYTVTENDDAYSTVSGVAKKDVVLVAVKAGKIVDAYAPDKADGTISAISTKKIDETSIKTYTVGGKGYEAAAVTGENVDGLAVNATTEYTVYLDKYGYLKEADKVEATATEQYMLVNVVYTVLDKYGSGTLYVKGVLEDGTVVEDLKVSDAQGNAITSASLYKLEGTVYKYKETAAGYEFTNSGIQSTDAKDANIDANAVRVNGTYVANNAKMVTVTGKNAGELAATAGAISKVTAGKYQCVANNKDGRITTIFVENPSASSATKKVIYVSNANVGNDTLYTNNSTKRSVAAKQIEYYTADTDETAQTMYVDKNANVTVGFYGEMEEIGALEDGTAVFALSARAPEATLVGQTIVETNGGSVIKVGNADYNLGEVEVIDLRSEDEQKESGVGAITDVSGLVEAVGAENTTVTVDFAYNGQSKDQAKPVTQIYVTNVVVARPAPAPAPVQ